MLSQASTVLAFKNSQAQAAAYQHMQQLQAELLATQARLAAANAHMHQQTQTQLQNDLQRLSLLGAGGGWNPMGQHSWGPAQNPAANLLNAITPQFPAAALAEAQARGPGSGPTTLPNRVASIQANMQTGDNGLLQPLLQPTTQGSYLSSTGSYLYNAAADAAAVWRDSLTKLVTPAQPSAWWPWPNAAK